MITLRAPVVGAEYRPDVDLPAAWIVDMDGTLALRCDRDPYDETGVIDDAVNAPVANVVRALAFTGMHILVMSGRTDTCRGDTVEWLDFHDIPHDALFMRKTGDARRDAEVKLELFDRHVRHDFHVLGAIDDRNSVVALWRGLGLTCLQVAPGDF